MNIRVALKTTPVQAFRMVVRQGFVPVLAGLACGIAGSLAVGAVVKNLLFGVQARDPVVMVSSAMVVGAVGLVACAIAARQGWPSTLPSLSATSDRRRVIAA